MGLNYTGADLNLSHSLFGCKVCALWFNIYTIDVGLRLNQAYPYFKASQLAAYLGIFWGRQNILGPRQATWSPTRKLQADCLKLVGLGLVTYLAKICIQTLKPKNGVIK